MQQNTTYTAAEIQRYINGEMSAGEMHALEKAALDDPFLADALDGYLDKKSNAPETITRDVEALQHRLQSRLNEKKKIIPFTLNALLRVAALFILTGGAVLLVYTFLNKNTGSKTAVVKTEATPPQMATTDSLAAAAPATVDSSHSLVYEAPARKTIPLKADRKSTVKDPPVPLDVPPVPLPQMEMKSKSLPMMAPGKEEESDKARARQPEQAIAERAAGTVTNEPASFLKESSALRFFTGAVIAKNHQPIRSALIIAGNEKDQSVSMSDKQGKFFFAVRDSVVDIAISSYGYKNYKATIPVRKEDQQFYMEDIPQGNKDLLRLPGEQSGSLPPQISFNTSYASPSTGWKEYYAYLEKNKKVFTDLYGVLEFSFVIEESGAFGNFNLLRSLSVEATDAAIALIKNGPKWNIRPQQTGHVRVLFRY